MRLDAKVWTAAKLRVGLVAEFERTVTEADVLDFARVSGDSNPLHVDAAYAAGTRFGRRIVHGAFQVGLASALIGMHLPGRHVLLGSVNARFPAPLYFPSHVSVRGEVTAWNPTTHGGQLRIVVLDKQAGVVTTEVVVAFTMHESADRLTAALPPAPAALGEARPGVLVTGAAGGLGSAIVRALAGPYTVLALVHRQALDREMVGAPHVHPIQASLSTDRWEELVSAALGGGTLYGVVHAAWPGAPHGGLLEAHDETIRQQLDFGTTQTIRLARFLADHAAASGGRFVALGSIFGSHKPALSLAAYSLGKTALETTVRLLAPELARKQITINAVCPSFVPVGMNQQSAERQRKLETARVPFGRLCGPDDVIGTIAYFFSPAAAFVSGQVLGVNGAQL